MPPPTRLPTARRQAAASSRTASIEVLELAFDAALAMMGDGRTADGKTIMLLQWAALDGPFAQTTSEESP